MGKYIRKKPYVDGREYGKLTLDSAKCIMKNLRILYHNVNSKQKTNVLAIVAKIFSRKCLKKEGFDVTQSIYINAKRKANGELNLNGYKRHRPQSKLKTSDEIKDQLKKFIIMHCNSS